VRAWLRALTLASLALGLALTSGAQGHSESSGGKPDDWHFLVGPFGWDFPAIEGTVTLPGNQQVPVDLPAFSRRWDQTGLNLSGHFEASKGPVGGGFDLFYMSLEDIPAQIPGEPNGQLALRQFIPEVFAFYTLAHGHGENAWSLQIQGGARIWATNTKSETDVLSKSLTWVDGIGGLRLQIPLGLWGLMFLGSGDVGAGGAKIDWSASGDLAVGLENGILLGAGYRTLDVDYSKPGVAQTRLVYDIVYKGPRVWVAITW
jgi:hypothetical protein